MTVVVLVVLAVVWGVVLFCWLRSRAKTSFGDSVGSFARRLHVLQRAAPSSLPAANRLGRPGWNTNPAYRQVPGARPLQVVGGSSRGVQSWSMASVRRRQAQKRRRAILIGLTGVASVSLLLALAVGGSVILGVQVVCDLALVGYVVLLARLRSLAVARAQEVRQIRPPVAVGAPPYRLVHGEQPPSEWALRRAVN